MGRGIAKLIAVNHEYLQEPAGLPNYPQRGLLPYRDSNVQCLIYDLVMLYLVETRRAVVRAKSHFQHSCPTPSPIKRTEKGQKK